MLSHNSVIKSVFLFVCCFAYSVYSFETNAQVIRVGLIDYPPHINFDEDLSKSPLYQYINTTLLPLGFTLKYVKLPRERASIELFKGRVDVLMPIPLENETMKTLSLPIFHSVPGLCFKKENFIPILSAIHRLDNLTIGVPASSKIVAGLTASKANLLQIKGENATNRGLEMTQRGWLDAFYHPSPIKVYHRKNPAYKELACSYFHGFATPVYIGISPKLPEKTFNLINATYQKAITKQSYEYYFASRE